MAVIGNGRTCGDVSISSPRTTKKGENVSFSLGTTGSSVIDQPSPTFLSTPFTPPTSNVFCSSIILIHAPERPPRRPFASVVWDCFAFLSSLRTGTLPSLAWVFKLCSPHREGYRRLRGTHEASPLSFCCFL